MPVTAAFYAQLRNPCAGKPALFPKFTQQQVDALNAIASVFDVFKGHDHCTDDLAYIMATCYRECGPALDLTIQEYGHGSRKAYGVPTGPYNKKYYGRGPCQVTWYANYNTAKLATGIDFVQFPEYMCDPAKGIVYMIEAMYSGRFTKHCLRNYITPGKVTTLAAFALARHIINGTDHAEDVAYIALAFQAALNAGYELPAHAVIKALPTVVLPQAPRLSLWAAFRHMLGGK